MKYVYLLWYTTQADTYADDCLLLGVYSSKKVAQQKIDSHYSTQAGFRDHPEGFEISEYEIDHMEWTEGFRSVPTRRQVRKQKRTGGRAVK